MSKKTEGEQRRINFQVVGTLLRELRTTDQKKFSAQTEINASYLSRAEQGKIPVSGEAIDKYIFNSDLPESLKEIKLYQIRMLAGLTPLPEITPEEALVVAQAIPKILKKMREQS